MLKKDFTRPKAASDKVHDPQGLGSKCIMNDTGVAFLLPDLNKVPRVHLFERDFQVEYDVIPSGDVSVLLLSVAPEHKPKVPEEAAEGGACERSRHTAGFGLTEHHFSGKTLHEQQEI